MYNFGIYTFSTANNKYDYHVNKTMKNKGNSLGPYQMMDKNRRE